MAAKMTLNFRLVIRSFLITLMLLLITFNSFAGESEAKRHFQKIKKQIEKKNNEHVTIKLENFRFQDKSSAGAQSVTYYGPSDSAFNNRSVETSASTGQSGLQEAVDDYSAGLTLASDLFAASLPGGDGFHLGFTLNNNGSMDERLSVHASQSPAIPWTVPLSILHVNGVAIQVLGDFEENMCYLDHGIGGQPGFHVNGWDTIFDHYEPPVGVYGNKNVKDYGTFTLLTGSGGRQEFSFGVPFNFMPTDDRFFEDLTVFPPQKNDYSKAHLTAFVKGEEPWYTKTPLSEVFNRTLTVYDADGTKRIYKEKVASFRDQDPLYDNLNYHADYYGIQDSTPLVYMELQEIVTPKGSRIFFDYRLPDSGYGRSILTAIRSPKSRRLYDVQVGPEYSQWKIREFEADYDLNNLPSNMIELSEVKLGHVYRENDIPRYRVSSITNQEGSVTSILYSSTLRDGKSQLAIKMGEGFIYSDYFGTRRVYRVDMILYPSGGWSKYTYQSLDDTYHFDTMTSSDPDDWDYISNLSDSFTTFGRDVDFRLNSVDTVKRYDKGGTLLSETSYTFNGIPEGIPGGDFQGHYDENKYYTFVKTIDFQATPYNVVNVAHSFESRKYKKRFDASLTAPSKDNQWLRDVIKVATQVTVFDGLDKVETQLSQTDYDPDSLLPVASRSGITDSRELFEFDADELYEETTFSYVEHMVEEDPVTYHRAVCEKAPNGIEKWTYYRTNFLEAGPGLIYRPQLVEEEYVKDGVNDLAITKYEYDETPAMNLSKTRVYNKDYGTNFYHDTQFFYDDSNRLERVIDPMGREEIYEYTTQSPLAKYVALDGSVNETSKTIEADGVHPTKITQKNSGGSDLIRYMEYNAQSQLLYGVDASGVIVGAEYDRLGRSTKTFGPGSFSSGGTEVSLPYQENTYVDYVPGTPSHVIQKQYVGVGQFIESKAQVDGYARNNLNTVKGTLGREIEMSQTKFDGLGRDIETENADGYVGKKVYNNVGQVTKLIAQGRDVGIEDTTTTKTRTLSFAEFQNLGGQYLGSFPPTIVTETTVTDPTGKTHSEYKDWRGVTFARNLPGIGWDFFEYNKRGNLIRHVSAGGVENTWGYDFLNRQTSWTSDNLGGKKEYNPYYYTPSQDTAVDPMQGSETSIFLDYESGSSERGYFLFDLKNFKNEDLSQFTIKAELTLSTTIALGSQVLDREIQFSGYTADWQEGQMWSQAPAGIGSWSQWHLVESPASTTTFDISGIMTHLLKTKKDFTPGIMCQIRPVEGDFVSLSIFSRNTPLPQHLPQLRIELKPIGETPTWTSTHRSWYFDDGSTAYSQSPIQKDKNEYTFNRYDGLGRLTHSGVLTWSGDNPFEAPAENYDAKMIYTYDDPRTDGFGVGRLSDVTIHWDRGHYGKEFYYDARGNIVKETMAIAFPGLQTLGKTYEFSYDFAGRLESMLYPPGGVPEENRLITYRYDQYGRLEKVGRSNPDRSNADEDFYAWFGYTDAGEIAWKKLGNSALPEPALDVIYERNSHNGRVTKICDTRGVFTQTFNYYDLNNPDHTDGLIKYQSFQAQSPLNPGTSHQIDWNYTYDDAGRLTDAVGSLNGDAVELRSRFGADSKMLTLSRVHGSWNQNLTYHYEERSHRLDTVDMSGNDHEGTENYEYSFNGNGGIQYDKYRHVWDVQYDFRGLVKSLQFQNDEIGMGRVFNGYDETGKRILHVVERKGMGLKPVDPITVPYQPQDGD